MMSSMHLLSLVTVAVLAGCGGPPPTSQSLSAWIYEDGAVVEVRASAEPADAVIDAEWSITIENRVDEPCAVGIYAWVGDAFLGDFRIDRPNVSTPEEWPSTWQGAALVDSGLVEGSGALVLGEEPIHEPAKNIFGRYVIMTCPDAELIMHVQVDAVVDYPEPWTSDREMTVSLRRLAE
jgi:hypothetical protein